MNQRLKRMKKHRSRSRLIEATDKAYSIHIRTKYADKDGLIKCYTCDRKYPIKKMQCGHYISRFYKYTRWEFDNLRPQCMMCNLWKRGDIPTFRARLVSEIGEDKVKAMEKISKQLFKENDSWIEEKLNLIHA